MDTPLLTSEQLAGVHAKLERANESIRNLNTEITAFLKEHPAGGYGEDKEKQIGEWAKYHAERGIPARFGLIAGEIAHHLRSSLDHIAWLLSSDAYRADYQREIAFPVLTERPATKDKLASYNRKVQGIVSPEALEIIERVQPYNARNPLDDPLAIVHDLDRVDKHHTLALVVGTFDAQIEIPAASLLLAQVLPQDIAYLGFLGQLNPERYPKPDFAKLNMKIELKFSRQVAFARLGQRERQTVIPSLTQLANAVSGVVELFGNCQHKEPR